jgi:hypothetical protein
MKFIRLLATDAAFLGSTAQKINAPRNASTPSAFGGPPSQNFSSDDVNIYRTQ